MQSTKTILFYASFVKRSRDTESILVAFRNRGHRVLFLNQNNSAEFGRELTSNGIEVFEFNSRVKNIRIRHIINVCHLIYFSWKNNVDVIFSHLEPANFVTVFAQYFIRSQTIICRHHSDLYALMKRDQDLSYRLIYQLAKNIIVVSNKAKKHMVEIEKVKPHKIAVINLAYNFSLYAQPSKHEVEKIKAACGGSILLLTIGHLNVFKRPLKSLEVLKLLREAGIHAKLIFLGTGDLLEQLKQKSIEWSIADAVTFPGFATNVIDYLDAADFVLHPSVSESSCVTIKEAGLISKPVVVCKGVGDFDDYIRNGVNGFLVDKDNFVEETVSVVLANHNRKIVLEGLGQQLHKDVKRIFDIEQVLQQYDALFLEERTDK